jgi:hypothetical protein
MVTSYVDMDRTQNTEGSHESVAHKYSSTNTCQLKPLNYGVWTALLFPDSSYIRSTCLPSPISTNGTAAHTSVISHGSDIRYSY